MMYDTGRVNPVTGKRILSAKVSSYATNVAGIPVPCGKCPACLESRRNEWCKRLMLEATSHAVNSFCTLTYDDIHLPSDRKANKSHIQLFVKRFRHAQRDYNVPDFDNFAYFIASEYGSKFGRPHYHGIMFGVDLLDTAWKPNLVSLKDGRYPILTSRVLSDIWSLGFVTVDRASAHTVKYVSKYITKQGSWSLKSIGLGARHFLDKRGRSFVGLKPFGRDTILNGSITLEGAYHTFYTQRMPKFLLPYVERFDRTLYDAVKARSRDYLLSSPLPNLSALAKELSIKCARENKERKLDNDS